MNIPKIISAFGLIDDKFLLKAEEAEIRKSGRFRFKPLLLAAVISVSVCGLTAAAIGIGGLERLKEYFVTQENRFEYGVPTVRDPESYGVEFREDDLQEGEAKVVSITSDGHSFFALIDYLAPAKALEDMSENEILSFEKFGDNCSNCSLGLQPVSRYGNLFTYVYYCGGIKTIPEDEIVITLEEFGRQRSDFAYEVISDGSVEAAVAVSDIKFLEPSKSKNTVTVYGAEISAELSPLGILLTLDRESYLEAEKQCGGKLLQISNIAIYMEDGTEYSFGAGNSPSLFRSDTGWVENGVQFAYMGFSAPLDISKIEKITLYDQELIFEEDK